LLTSGVGLAVVFVAGVADVVPVVGGIGVVVADSEDVVDWLESPPEQATTTSRKTATTDPIVVARNKPRPNMINAALRAFLGVPMGRESRRHCPVISRLRIVSSRLVGFETVADQPSPRLASTRSRP
jgi:hypothetical protein